MTKPKVAVTIGRSHYDRMFSERAWQQLEDMSTVVHHEGDEPANREELIDLLPGVLACITSWGVAQLDAEVIAAADSLDAGGYPSVANPQHSRQSDRSCGTPANTPRGSDGPTPWAL